MEKENKRSKSGVIIRILFGIGLLLFAIYLWKYYKTEHEVKGSIRLIGYISFFAISISAYLFLISKKKVVFSNIFLLAILLMSVEIWCFFKLKQPSYFKQEFNSPISDPEHISNKIGTVLYPDSVYVNVKDTGNGKAEIKYSIDHFFKRVTPGHSDNKKKFALFFGCSLTFGENVNDDNTLPYYFQQNSNEYNSYNFGQGGKGANFMLARLQTHPLTEQVKEKEGIAFYIFFWDHIYRSIGTMNRYTTWMAYEPYYFMKDGKVVRDRLFIDGRSFTSWIYELIYQTNIVKYFKLDFPLKLNKSHLELVSGMIMQSKLEYVKQFGNDNFYCVIFPEYGNVIPPMHEDFINMLKEKNIKVIDLSKTFYYGPGESLMWDNHPKPKTNDSLATIIFNQVISFTNEKK